ncbi:MAG: hypothetical protein IK099_10860 [Clostridia bacterium]|nr:hypothetical protein [Clostridia bacterium]
MENKSVFRKEALARISSPEQMEDYMQVASPRLWMVLSAVIALLIGFVVFASTATMENVARVQAEVATDTLEDGTKYSLIVFDIPREQEGVLKIGMPLRIGDKEGQIAVFYRSSEDNKAGGVLNDLSVLLLEGSYDVEIVTETTTPISFLLN